MLTRDLTPISVEVLRRFKLQRGVKAEFEGWVENREVPYRCRKMQSSMFLSAAKGIKITCSQKTLSLQWRSFTGIMERHKNNSYLKKIC